MKSLRLVGMLQHNVRERRKRLFKTGVTRFYPLVGLNVDLGFI
jgi:hypothetical protein